MSTIPRDLGSPFDPTDPVQLAEFEGFGTDVPNTRGMIAAAQQFPTHAELLDLVEPLPGVHANRVRAAKLFSELFLPTIAATGGDDGDDFPTPDPVAPDEVDANFMRTGRARTVSIFPPGDDEADNDVRVWSFEGTNNGVAATDSWPAPTIRVREGDTVHVLMSNSHGVHTIHHHGIEPTPVNDGVGHLTMEIGGDGDTETPGGTYHYQWMAAEAGTYFYHCHRNTVLHFELGMYGMLIVDPPEPVGATVSAPYQDGGPGYILVGDEPKRYDVETFWVVDDIDVRWHGFGGQHLHRSAGIPDPAVDGDGNPVFMAYDALDNPRLNDFLAGQRFFVVTGVTVGDGTSGSEAGVLEQPTQDQMDENDSLGALYNFIQPQIAPNQTLLIRALNASYCTSVWRFPANVNGTVVGVDGRTLGRSGFGAYSEPFRLSDLPLDSTGQFRQFTLTTAQRWDILLDAAAGDVALGEHLVLVEFRHWLDYDLVLQTAILPIQVGQTT